MIPLHDDTPRFSTPYVTYFLIALNTLVFFYELMLSAEGHRYLEGFMYQFGVVPSDELAIVSGTTDLKAAAGSIPICTSMFPHASWLQILGNMWVVWIFSDTTED